MKTFAIRSAIAAISIFAIAGTASAASITPAKPFVSETSNIVLANGHRGERGFRKLSTKQLVHALYHQGYRNVHRVTYRKGIYYVRADGRRGPVKLMVSARSGHVIGRTPLRPRYGYSYHGGNRNGFSWSFSIR